MMTSPLSGSDPTGDAVRATGFEALHPRVQRWVWEQNWGELRSVQVRAISPIMSGKSDVIISAATASGKTEAAWLPICSVLATEADSGEAATGIKALYLSPLKALINDQFDRLQSLGELADLPVHRRHGDVTGSERKALTAEPDGVLLMTPESLEAQFVLRGPHVPAMFGGLRYIVIDEMHSFMGTERGAQLQSLLHRIELATRRRIPRIALSATFADFSAATEFLRPRNGVQVEIVDEAGDSGSDLRMQLRGYVASRHTPRARNEHDDPLGAEEPVEYSSSQRAISEHLFGALRGEDNLVFANSRANVEAYSDMLREASETARVPNEFFPHHGNLSKQFREDVEARLKKSDAPATAICTSTLEMGIDIGSADSVAQIGPPYSVAALRQRVGRSGRRGKPATLRLYVQEADLDANTSVTDRLRTGLFQTIAVIELMLERWYESPNLSRLHLSTLIQQSLSIIAQHGGATASQLFSALCSDGPFEHVTRPQFVELLKSIGKSDLIIQAGDDTLLPGLIGERLINHYSFYTSFHTSDEYRLLHQGQVLGTIPVDFPVLVNSLLIFAGKRWAVKSVDASTKTIELARARGGLTPQFGHGGGNIADGIRRKMRELYLSPSAPAYLDPIASVLFTQGKAAFAQYKLAEEATVQSGEDCLLFAWRGTVICNTLSVILNSLGVKNSVEDMSITCQAITKSELLTILAAVTDMPKPTAEELAELAPVLQVDKNDEFLSDQLLIASSALRDFDVGGAWDELQSIVAANPAPPTQLSAAWQQDSSKTMVELGSTQFVVVDVETTGLSPANGARIVEIAIVTLDATAQVVDRWATLIDSGTDTGPEHIHGISNEDVKGAPTFAEVIDEVAYRLSGKIVVAHNAAFDLRFLTNEFKLADAQPTEWPTLCTMRLARRTLPESSSNLASLCELLSIPTQPTHAALDDALATAELLKELLVLADNGRSLSAKELGIAPLAVPEMQPAPSPPTFIKPRVN